MARLATALVLAIGLTVVHPSLSLASHGEDDGSGVTGHVDSNQILIDARRKPQSKPVQSKQPESAKQVLVPLCYTYRSGTALPAAGCVAPADFCPDSRQRAYVDAGAAQRVNELPIDEYFAKTFRCLTNRQAPKPLVTEREFRRLPIPAPPILAQPDPAKGHTLINIETNFLTAPGPALLNTTVLGQAVQVRATPSSYHWTYGDGAGLTTRSPGGKYPNMLTPHTYRQPGTFQVQLNTTFTGEFSVAGGPWQPIDGTATTTSPAIQVTAEERRAVLIS